MTEEVTAHPRRKQTLARTVGKHANRSSTRLNSKMSRAAGASGIAPLTKLNGDGPGDGATPRFLSDRPRDRSTDSIPRVPSANRIAGKVGALSNKSGRKPRNGDTTSSRKAVIQLEHETSDNGSSTSFEDTDSDNEGETAHGDGSAEADDSHALSTEPANEAAASVKLDSPQSDQPTQRGQQAQGSQPPRRPNLYRRSSSALSVGISNVAPTPPQISTETVVSVTSAVDMANVLNVMSSKSQFVEEGDFISRAVHRSQSAADLKDIVGTNMMRTQQKMLVRQRQSHAVHSTPMPENAEARRGYERAVKEYINARQLKSPVQASLQRIATRGYARTTPVPPHSSDLGSTGEGSDAQLKIASLSATTMNEMAGLTMDSPDVHPSSHAQHMSNYLLLNLWNEGWVDPEKVDVDAQAASDDIQAQAQKVYQRISAPQWSRRRSSTVKLV